MHFVAIFAIAFVGADENQIRAKAILHPASPSTSELMAIVEHRLFSTTDQRKFQIAIQQLESDSFQKRERATQQLLELGVKTLPRVEDEAKRALATHDAERMDRLQHVRDRLSQLDDSQRIWAAATRLKAEPSESHQHIAKRLLETLPAFPTRYLRAPMVEATWRHARSASLEDQKWMRALLQQGTAHQRAASLVVLSGLNDDASLARTLLKSPSPEVSLAAARVMTRTNVDEAIDVLLATQAMDQRGLRGEATYLLRSIFRASEEVGTQPAPPTQPAGARLEAYPQSNDAWRAWRKTATLKPLTTAVAFRWGVLHIGIREEFDKERKTIAEGYGPFVYQTTTPAKASVSNGRLILDGEHAEGDQRLSISAQTLVSAPTIASPFVVQAGMGGKPGNEVGWHVGVSIGRAKFLFHPGYAGGAFRVEDTVTHNYLLSNQTMPFTPQTDVIHHMRLEVEPQADGGAKVKMTLTHGTTLQEFVQSILLTRDQIGPLNRVGLERSGRSGGAAMFDFIDVATRD